MIIDVTRNTLSIFPGPPMTGSVDGSRVAIQHISRVKLRNRERNGTLDMEKKKKPKRMDRSSMDTWQGFPRITHTHDTCMQVPGTASHIQTVAS